MPKPRPDIDLMRTERIIKKNLPCKNSPSGTISICILGNGSPESPSALLLRTEHSQILFNCGESTQRVCFANAIKITKLEHICITQPTWKNIGGLLGLSLTLQGMGIPSINIHSTTKFTDFFAATRGFAVADLLQIIDSTPDDRQNFSNVDLDINYLLVHGENRSGSGDSKKMRTLTLPVLCYLCRLSDVPGTLDFHKCMAAKVPRGPLLAQLKDGKDVTLADGSIVKAEDVRGPNQPGSYFLVVECPSLDYLENLASQNALQQFYNNSDDLMSHIFHLTPHPIAQSKEYQSWIKSFSPSVTHIMLNEESIGSPNIGVGILQEKFRLLDENIFPQLHLSSNYTDIDEETHNLIQPLPCATVPLRPRVSRNGEKQPTYVTTSVPTFVPGSYRGVICDLPEVKEAIELYQEKTKNLPDSPVYPVVTFFGTASAVPGKDRNTSCIFINLNENDAIMLDCAEGSLSQMMRMFGDQLPQNLTKLHTVYISHMHADHHLGLIDILLKRKQFIDKPLSLIVPKAVGDWIIKYSREIESLDGSYKIHLNDSFMHPSHENSSMSKKIGLKQLQTCRVRHCRDSFGVSLLCHDDFKIVYSGDAMPSNHLVTMGKTADILIHEATMEDGLEQDAKMKCHSTISQAIKIGQEMQAKNIILTHFSQRYAKIPIINKSVLDEATNVSCAFDNMRIRRCDLPKLPLMIPALQAMFKEYEDQTLLKTYKRKMREKIIDEILDT